MWLRRVIPGLFFLLACSGAWAEDAPTAEPTSPKKGWYVVRPGDTLIGLTERYLGSRDRWQENFELNAGRVKDPHQIRPGQILELLLDEKLPDGALLTRVSNRVEDQPTPLVWSEAREGELLRAKDGIKTHQASSAQLLFHDDTVLLLTEESIVFLGEEARVAEVDRTQIEIVVGQADLAGPAASAAGSEFEIVLGDAKATPRPVKDSAVQTRARRAEAGGAQLMVYGGESELEAAGGKVKVAAGMGSSVPEGEPPKPPEKLLPAPSGLEPTAGMGLATPQPLFTWEPVEGARDYTLEICRDDRCGSLLERAQGLTETTWRPERLPVESLFWRVTAVSDSGLDGYPASSVPFAITSDTPDTVPPRAQVTFVGPRLAPRFGLNETWIVGPGMEIEVEVEDPESGVFGWTAAIDGEEIPVERLKGPWERGRHTVEVRATDRAGNRGGIEVPFIFDPDPPELTWGAEGDAASLGDIGNGNGASAATPSLRGLRELRVGKLDWELDSDLAHVVIRPLTRKPVRLEGLGLVGSDQGLWVQADDDVCTELDSLTYELESLRERKEFVLRVWAVDCVGNARGGELPLVKTKRR